MRQAAKNQFKYAPISAEATHLPPMGGVTERVQKEIAKFTVRQTAGDTMALPAMSKLTMSIMAGKNLKETCRTKKKIALEMKKFAGFSLQKNR